MLRTVTRSLVTAARAARLSTSAGAQSQTQQRLSPLAAAGTILGAAGLAYVASTEKAQCFFWGKSDSWDAIRKDVEGIIDKNTAGPIFVRLAWHAAGTYDKNTKTGGSNGATMRFSPESGHGANNGLNLARDLLEPVKAKYPSEFFCFSVFLLLCLFVCLLASLCYFTRQGW